MTTSNGSTTSRYDSLPSAVPVYASEASPSLRELYGRRDYVRSMLDSQAKSGRADIAATTNREMAGINPSQGGIYANSGVAGALRSRAQQSGARTGSYLESLIGKSRTRSEMNQTSDIASQFSHEEDRMQGYASAQARGNAQADAQREAETMGLVGTLGAAALFALV